jgi:hypothetical protein
MSEVRDPKVDAFAVMSAARMSTAIEVTTNDS